MFILFSVSTLVGLAGDPHKGAFEDLLYVQIKSLRKQLEESGPEVME